MKAKLINIGRHKINKIVEVFDKGQLVDEVSNYLLSSEISIDFEEDNGNFGTVFVGGFRAVGNVEIIEE